MKFTVYLHFIFCSCYSLIACSQSITPVPAEIIPKEYNRSKVDLEFNQYKKNAVDLTTFLPTGYVKDGSVDYTGIIQNALQNNKIVLFPNFPILINDRGLKLGSGTVLLFNTQSKIILKSSNKGNYDILSIQGVNNVKLYFPRIEGDIFRHKGSSGEWGMGITIKSSSNVSIYNGIIEGCWGDGIYVGATFSDQTRKWGDISNNIVIYNTICNYNGRNGLSLVAGNNINVYNSTFANSRRTFPKAGIDIEPGSLVLDNIKLTNNVTYRNKARGIDFMLRRFTNYNNNNINISIDGHNDYLSMVGMRVAGINSNDKKKYKIAGRINVSGFKSSGNNRAVKFEDIQDFNPYFNLNGNVVIDQNKAQNSKISQMNLLNFK